MSIIDPSKPPQPFLPMQVTTKSGVLEYHYSESLPVQIGYFGFAAYAEQVRLLGQLKILVDDKKNKDEQIEALRKRVKELEEVERAVRLPKQPL